MGSSSLMQRWNTLTTFQKLMIGGFVLLVLYGVVSAGVGGGSRVLDPSWLLAVASIVFIALPVHEFAHAWMAVKLGDDTPKWQGRYTLNPLVHIDPIGAMLILFIGFGWAKPVQWNPNNIAVDKRFGSILVAIIGPLSNLALAVIAVALRGLVTIPGAAQFIDFFVFINVLLFVFNMVPVPPLDGSHVLFALLPGNNYRLQMQVSRYGFFILIGIVMFAPQIIYVPTEIIVSTLNLLA